MNSRYYPTCQTMLRIYYLQHYSSENLETLSQKSPLVTVFFFKNGHMFTRQTTEANHAGDDTLPSFSGMNINQISRAVKSLMSLKVQMNNQNNMVLSDKFHMFSEVSKSDIYLNLNKLILVMLLSVQDITTKMVKLEHNQLSANDNLPGSIPKSNAITDKITSDLKITQQNVEFVNMAMNNLTDSCTQIISDGEKQLGVIEQRVQKMSSDFQTAYQKFVKTDPRFEERIDELDDRLRETAKNVQNTNTNSTQIEASFTELKNHGNQLSELSSFEKNIESKVDNYHNAANNDIANCRNYINQTVADLMQTINATNLNTRSCQEQIANNEMQHAEKLSSFEERLKMHHDETKHLSEYVGNGILASSNKVNDMQLYIQGQMQVVQNSIKTQKQTNKQFCTRIEEITGILNELRAEFINSVNDNQNSVQLIKQLHKQNDSKDSTINKLVVQIEALEQKMSNMQNELNFQNEIMRSFTQRSSWKSTKAIANKKYPTKDSNQTVQTSVPFPSGGEAGGASVVESNV